MKNQKHSRHIIVSRRERCVACEFRNSLFPHHRYGAEKRTKNARKKGHMQGKKQAGRHVRVLEDNREGLGLDAGGLGEPHGEHALEQVRSPAQMCVGVCVCVCVYVGTCLAHGRVSVWYARKAENPSQYTKSPAACTDVCVCVVRANECMYDCLCAVCARLNRTCPPASSAAYYGDAHPRPPTDERGWHQSQNTYRLSPSKLLPSK